MFWTKQKLQVKYFRLQINYLCKKKKSPINRLGNSIDSIFKQQSINWVISINLPNFYNVHFCCCFFKQTNQSGGSQRVKTRPVVTDSLVACGAPETLPQRGGENSATHRVLKASLPLPLSPVTNYLCYFTHPPLQQTPKCVTQTHPAFQQCQAACTARGSYHAVVYLRISWALQQLQLLLEELGDGFVDQLILLLETKRMNEDKNVWKMLRRWCTAA